MLQRIPRDNIISLTRQFIIFRPCRRKQAVSPFPYQRTCNAMKTFLPAYNLRYQFGSLEYFMRTKVSIKMF